LRICSLNWLILLCIVLSNNDKNTHKKRNTKEKKEKLQTLQSMQFCKAGQTTLYL